MYETWAVRHRLNIYNYFCSSILPSLVLQQFFAHHSVTFPLCVILTLSWYKPGLRRSFKYAVKQNPRLCCRSHIIGPRNIWEVYEIRDSLKCSKNNFISEKYEAVQPFKLQFLQNSLLVQLYTSANAIKFLETFLGSHFVEAFSAVHCILNVSSITKVPSLQC